MACIQTVLLFLIGTRNPIHDKFLAFVTNVREFKVNIASFDLMPKIKVSIIEDEFFVANQLSDYISELGFDVVGIFHSGESFLQETDWNFDVAVVDIFLSDSLTGLDIGEKLKERKIPFMFLTANVDEHTLMAAARLRPEAYITKPFQKFDIAAALEIIRLSLTKKISVRTAHGQEEINPNDIYYIKGDAGYCEIHYKLGRIVQRKLLKEYAEELNDDFVRVHRSYLVNRHFITSKTGSEVIVNGQKIPISRSYKHEF